MTEPTSPYVLVPREMDVGMIAAFWRQKNTGAQAPGETGPDTSDAAAYRAMIAAGNGLAPDLSDEVAF